MIELDVARHLREVGVDVVSSQLVRDVEHIQGNLLRVGLTATMPNGESMDAYISQVGSYGTLEAEDGGDAATYAHQLGWFGSYRDAEQAVWDAGTDVRVQTAPAEDWRMSRVNCRVAVTRVVCDAASLTALLLDYVIARVAIHEALRGRARVTQ